MSSKPWSYSAHIKGGDRLDYKLPISLRMDKTPNLQNGIEILSTSDVSVLCLNYQSYGNGADGYLALPTRSLGLFYVVASYQPYSSSYKANIVVISAHHNTTIIVYPKRNAVVYYRGLRYDDTASLMHKKMVLGKLEALYILGSSDLSGTTIIASKQVSVISGVSRSRLATSRSNFLEAFQLPTSLWGYQYILTNMGIAAKTPGDIFRIFAYKNNTIVETAYWIKTLSSGKYTDLILDKDLASFVKCNKPCQVIQYIRGVAISRKYAEPTMIVLPSVNQFLSYYRVVLPYVSEYYDSTTIVIKTDQTHGLYMNGIKLNGLEWKRINGTEYSWTFVRFLGSNTVTVYHISPAVTFGLIVFDLGSSASYVYSGGYALGNHSHGKLLFLLFVFNKCVKFYLKIYSR